MIAVGSQDHTACNNMNQCHKLSSIQFHFTLYSLDGCPDLQYSGSEHMTNFTLNTVFSHCTAKPATIDVKL